MYCRLLTGLRLLNSASRPGFSNKGETSATFQISGNWPVDNDALMLDITRGRNTFKCWRRILVGIGSAYDYQPKDAVVFPCEEEIMEKLKGTLKAETGMSHSQDPTFRPNQPLAVIWDERGTVRWYIGFYLNDNGDGTFQVDHLMRTGTLEMMTFRTQ